MTVHLRATRLLLGLNLLLLGGGCGATSALFALSSAEVSHIEDVRFEEDAVSGLVLIGWPEQPGPSPCLEELDWRNGDLHLSATPYGPCPGEDGRAAGQWVRVETTPATLSTLAATTKLGKGTGKVVLRIGEKRHVLAGAARPGFKLAPDAVIELGHSIGTHSVRLELGGLLDPRVRIVLGVMNSLDLDLPVSGGTWQLRRGDQVFAQGSLELPEVLSADTNFEVAIQLGPSEGLGIAGGLLAPGSDPLSCRADVVLDTPWGQATVRSDLGF